MNLLEKNTDPFEIASAFGKVCAAWMQNSEGMGSLMMEMNSKLCESTTEAFWQMLSEKDFRKKPPGKKKDTVVEIVKRCSKVARKYHSICGSYLNDLTEKAPGIGDSERQRSLFWTRQFVTATAPSNFFWTNPGAVQRFIRSKGESAERGIQNCLEDIQRGDHLIKIADSGAFEVGKNLATTPGHVVFRNELMEVIQYAPATESTYAVPIVLIQPWINKFYIFDLSASSSFVRYLLNQGFSVFITSWKNPDSGMRHITFDDYMLRGALKAIDVAHTICGTEQVHAAGYCIGGTALAALMAWLSRSSDPENLIPVADWTVFSTLTDFSEPGELGVFIDEKGIGAIEELMRKDGYLDGKYMGQVFRLLRSDSLIWRYMAHNYLCGESPPKSDMLYWNSDTSRLPEAMCSFYLREFYLKNRLAQKDGLILGDRPIDLGRIGQPLYAVGAEQDHISPWKQTFRICSQVSGPVRYVLTSEGHIAGIVNPPSPRSKKKFRSAAVENGLDADAWLGGQPAERGSWWLDWIKWLSERNGPMGKPHSVGCEAYPCLEKAPGRYVRDM